MSRRVGGWRVHLLPKNVDVLGQLGERTWLVFSRPGLASPVLVSVAEDAGRLVCTGVVVGATYPGTQPTSWRPAFPTEQHEVTARSLREIPIGTMLAHLSQAASRVPPGPDPLRGAGDLSRPFDAPAAYAAAVLNLAGKTPGPVMRRPGPAGYPPEHFRQVADAYRRALKIAPAAPWPTFRDELRVSDSTARRWIRRARDLGYLGPSTPGRAGEQRQRKGVGRGRK